VTSLYILPKSKGSALGPQLVTISLAPIFWQPVPKVAGVPALTAAIE
jgi:hypothetical protein